MIGRLLDRAPEGALRRVVRARIGQWTPDARTVDPVTDARDILGHLEDWSFDFDRGMVAGDPWLERSNRGFAQSRYARLVKRFGLARIVAAVQARAKGCLGRSVKGY